MPDFVLQLEQASGLPWWCLLLLAALVLVILVLAISLRNARLRAARGPVDIPKAPATGEDPLGREAPEDEHEADAKGEEEPEPELASEPMTEPEPAPEPKPVPEPESAPEPEPEPEPEAAPEPEPAPAPEPADESAPETPSAENGDEEPTAPKEDNQAPEPSQAADSPVEVFEKEARDLDLNVGDAEIFKATGGSHVRIGQSAFGIDFGFLEEYEAEYEHALEEFRRLRSKNEQE